MPVKLGATSPSHLPRSPRKATLPHYLTTYFLSSFLGWHFSQTLPSSAAFLQHSCLHFLPASTVASQHGFFCSFSWAPTRIRLEVAISANAQTTAVINLSGLI